MGGNGFRWFCRGVIILQLIGGILGWGKHGHYVICKIAEEYLTNEAKAAVEKLLPESAGGDLASVCSWADEIRHYYHWHWSGVLHYVDTPDFKCNYKYCRDCHDLWGHKHRCVTGAIFNYTRQLVAASDSHSISHYNLTEALMFLSHFMGDIHQPLHVGFTGDEGGNTIIVRWYRRKTNLHHVWDTMIIDSALKLYYQSDLANMIEAIQRNITVSSSSCFLPLSSADNANTFGEPDYSSIAGNRDYIINTINGVNLVADCIKMFQLIACCFLDNCLLPALISKN